MRLLRRPAAHAAFASRQGDSILSFLPSTIHKMTGSCDPKGTPYIKDRFPNKAQERLPVGNRERPLRVGEAMGSSVFWLVCSVLAKSRGEEDSRNSEIKALSWRREDLLN